ncbi:hypothetical protein [Vibrio diabolicus]|uniref:hypothetical protein n=1 Tax=Vibrio diabolicus TaxID=50719 RepID=UPI0011126B27|nr:hypothetical protein [Vibrio diabolicus]TNC04017.1 hypothetical protein FHG74_21315 [Vibrio diabolicus]
MIKNFNVENYKEISISISDRYDIRKHLSNLLRMLNQTNSKEGKLLLDELLDSLLKVAGNDAPTSTLSLDVKLTMPYVISRGEFNHIQHKINAFFEHINTSTFKREVVDELISIRKIWEKLEDKSNKDEWSSVFDHLNGRLDQLSTRQDEINLLSKTALEDIKERTDSAAANLARHAQKQSNQLAIQAKDLESELLSQIETTASNVKIDIKDESSKLWRELTEKITLTVDSTLEKKQKEIQDRNERHAKLLLEKVESDVSNLSSKVNEQINDFCLLNDALRKTLNFVASDALADTSIKQAKEEKATADSLRGWGILWLIASIGLFLLTFDYDKLVDENNVPQYTLILLRSFFLIVGITPGFYLLRESARHRTDERRYRQKGIQLATIDGYFAEFEDSERNKVKKDLSKHYFHGAEHFVDSSSVDHVQSKYDKIFDKVASSKKFN